MSGGVDSSVSAALLKKEGHDVTGVFMKVWQPDFLECMQGGDRLDAMRAAAHIGIPFLTFDFEKEYKKEVIDYMIAEYRVGRTPNPDVMCNKAIKFGAFLKKAKKMGADMIATGHYARPRRISKKLKVRKVKGQELYKLYTGRDSAKDQSYFLWTLTQEQLRHTLFPVGNYTKPKVREMARKFGLPNAERKESQGLCFIGKIDVKEFLKHYIKEKRGDVLNKKGEVIGFHEGVFFYTIGERRGFTITKKTPSDKPFYVVAKDVKKNTLTVSSRGRAEFGFTNEVALKNAHWISGTSPNPKKTYQARALYRQPLQEVRIMNNELRKKNNKAIIHNSKLTVQFKKPQRAISSGQSLVLYNNEECLGGGIIS